MIVRQLGNLLDSRCFMASHNNFFGGGSQLDALA
jgi:hypothetical protein